LKGHIKELAPKNGEDKIAVNDQHVLLEIYRFFLHVYKLTVIYHFWPAEKTVLLIITSLKSVNFFLL